jgi:hypothetical protein
MMNVKLKAISLLFIIPHSSFILALRAANHLHFYSLYG